MQHARHVCQHVTTATAARYTGVCHTTRGLHQATSNSMTLAAVADPAQHYPASQTPVAAAIAHHSPLVPGLPLRRRRPCCSTFSNTCCCYSAAAPAALAAPTALQHPQRRLLQPQRRCTCRTPARQKGSDRTPCCLSACRSRCSLCRLSGTRAVTAAAPDLHVLPAAGSDAATCRRTDRSSSNSCICIMQQSIWRKRGEFRVVQTSQNQRVNSMHTIRWQRTAAANQSVC
jgi:hypothetical protein